MELFMERSDIPICIQARTMGKVILMATLHGFLGGALLLLILIITRFDLVAASPMTYGIIFGGIALIAAIIFIIIHLILSKYLQIQFSSEALTLKNRFSSGKTIIKLTDIKTSSVDNQRLGICLKLILTQTQKAITIWSIGFKEKDFNFILNQIHLP
jgi:hypothetical protein